MFFKRFFSRNYQDKCQNLLWLFGLSLFVFAILSLVRIFYSYGFYMDTLEHIHAAWLISEGKVPYRDFFEHHHPLLWYLLSPITQFFYRDVNVIYAARLVVVLCHFISLLVMYKLVISYTASKIAAQIAILILLSVYPLWSDIQNIRPDIFMVTAVLAAILSFFKYLEKDKERYLVISYFLWFIAFLFLQKSLIPLSGFAFVNLLYIKKIRIPNIVKALLLPLIIAFALIWLMYETNTLSSWFDWNFVYNKYITGYYAAHSIVPLSFIITCLIVSVLIIRYHKTSLKGNVIFGIWFFVAVSLMFYAPYVQYFVLYMYLSVLLLSPYFAKLFNKYYKLSFCALTLFIELSLMLNFLNINSKKLLDENIKLSEYIIEMTDKDDELLTMPHSFNLFNNDANFYWFGFKHAVIIADLYMNKSIDINDVLHNKKPKFFTISNDFATADIILFYNSRWLRDRNTALIRKSSRGDRKALSKLSDINLDYWYIDMDFLQKNYHMIGTYGTTNLWQRKDMKSDTP